MSIHGWTVVRSEPDEYAHPDEIAGHWDGGLALAEPAPVATVTDVGDIDDYDWWHRGVATLDAPAFVHFAGLTFPAVIYVDGVEVAQCRSMFLPVRIELAKGRHEICVCFRSLNGWLRTRRPRGRWRSSLVSAAGLRWARTTLLGRAPIYGNLVAPVGFWRPVSVTPTSQSVSMRIAPDAASGSITIDGSATVDAAAPLEVVLADPDGRVVARTECAASNGHFQARLGVDDHQLWWPRGYGEQSVYRATIVMGGRSVAERLFGFRSVTADTSDGGFTLRVNDVAVFCRGATWSPPDPVAMTVDDATMEEHLRAFADAGANMVRIVGGLALEQPEFWNHCARLGLLVWQDAMLATFDPPAEITDVVVDEMVDLLDALSGNPALAVVSGGSETLQRPEMLGLDRDSSAIELIDQVLPAVVAEHADVPYVRATPAPPPDRDDVAIRPDSGVAHWFGVGGYLRPVSDVSTAGVRFAAECLAFANPPTSETIERHFGSAAVAGHDPRWKQGVPRDRGSSWDFEDVRDFYVREIFGEDPFAVRRVDPERYLQLGRLAITHAMTECFSFWRRADSRCSGGLVLTGKDMCAGAGWGLMDVDGVPKPAMIALARIWAPVAVVVSNAGLAGVRIDVHNDSPRTESGVLHVVAIDAKGVRTIEAKHAICVGANSSSTFFDTSLSGVFRDLSHSFRFGPANADGIEVVFHRVGTEQQVRDVLVVNPRPGQVHSGIRAVGTKCGSEWRLEITADSALRYVDITTPGWIPSENYFHLLARSPHTVSLRPGDPGVDREAPTGTVSSIDCLDRARIETT